MVRVRVGFGQFLLDPIYKGMVEAGSDWWRTFFGPSYLELYDPYLRERTPVEVDQLEALLQLRPPLRILDLPCGQGRHAIELARRGYHVTGVDLSAFMLEVARGRSKEAGVKVRWLEGDMRTGIPAERFDLVLNLFTSFGYFDDPADDRRVLLAAASMLGAGGRLVLEVINGERTMSQFQEREWFTVGRAAVLEDRRLDRPTQRMVVERTVSRPPESETSVHALRLYTGEQVGAALLAAGFCRVELYGDWNGEPLGRDSMRVIAIGSMAK
jgi:SAM-dependent methyltransferase